LAGASAAALAAAAPTPSVATSAALSSTNGILVLRTNQSSWVEVADAQGKVMVRRTLNAGEVVGLSGALPMRVVLGRADAMQVQVRGQAVNLAPVSRDNVARFEVR
jgi:cytoskeleton protein RodZ